MMITVGNYDDVHHRQQQGAATMMFTNKTEATLPPRGTFEGVQARIGDVSFQLDRLETLIDLLHSQVSDLENRLVPVRTPPTEMPIAAPAAEPRNASERPRTPAGERISSVHEHLAGLLDRLSRLSASIDI